MSTPLRRFGAQELTSVLLAPAPAPVEIGATARQVLLDTLTPAARAWRGRPLLQIDAHRLTHGLDAPETPFAWSPTLAKRTIGLAALRSCIWGLAATPAEAVLAELDRLVQRGEGGGLRPGALGAWLAGAPRGVRAAAAAAATTYATELWGAVDWSACHHHPTIGAADEVVALSEGPLQLRGRAEVRTVVAVADEFGPSLRAESRLMVLPGGPDERSALVLGASALATALSSRSGVAPSRYVGFYPQAGRIVTLEITEAVLRRSAAGVARRVLAAGAVAAA